MKIQGFSNYEIYPQEGRIWSYKSNKFVGSKNNKSGYWKCNLYADDGTIWQTTVHRVIWTAVNGEIPQGLDVNHRDENPSNNVISNLNLMTRKENLNYGTRTERASKAISKTNTNNPKRSKAVGAFKDGVLMMVFPSTNEAQRQGYKQSNVFACCKGLRQSHKGFQWQYLN